MDNLSILIRAILEKSSKSQIESELKNIEKNLKPLEISANVDKAKGQYKVLADGSSKIYKLTVDTTNALGQQVQTVAKVDQKTKELVVDTKNVTENYKKQREALAKTNAEQSKYWAQRRKETLDSMTSKNTELQKMGQYYTQLQKETGEEAKQNALIRERIALYQQQLAIKNRDLKTTYGTSYDAKGMTSIVNSANSLNPDDFKTVDDLNKKTKQLDLAVAKSTSGMKELRKQATLAMKESDGIVTTFIKDLGKLAVWGAAASILYTPLRTLREGVVYVVELDNALNEIRIVTSMTQTEVNKLAVSYNALAKEMSVTTKEIAGTAADLYRQGLDDNQVEERMKGIIQYAKISSISLEDSNKIITATANATGESVGKIIDVFALLGDTTA